ncbi:hypothetical protein HDV05_002663 [Chytridiales sp. JEL 0842]|nr:hypothetical protein HDV05_002663 [Chytridiales sp. JEL 0842]
MTRKQPAPPPPIQIDADEGPGDQQQQQLLLSTTIATPSLNTPLKSATANAGATTQKDAKSATVAYAFNQPTSAFADPNAPGESSNDIKAVILGLERMFKENAQTRRYNSQPQFIFSPDNLITSPETFSMGSDSLEDIIGRAKAELYKVKTQAAKAAEMKLIRSQEEDRKLKQRIRETREQFESKHQIVQAGPKFIRNFFCAFGEVEHVEMLAVDGVFAVFGSERILEIWECDQALDSLNEAKLLSTIQISELGSISCVCKLFSDDRILKERLRRAQEKARREGNGMDAGENGVPSEAQSETEIAETDTITPGAIDCTMRFFIGCQNGHGAIIDLTVKRPDYDNTGLVITYEVMQQKKISLNPIKLACKAMLDELTICTTIFTGNEVLLSGFSFVLDELWQCKIDTLKGVARDKQPRTILVYKMEKIQLTLSSTRSTGDELITGICSDPVLKQLIISLKSGSAITLYSKIKVPSAPSSDNGPKEETGSQLDLAPVYMRELTMSWSFDTLDMKVLEKEKGQRSESDEKEKEKGNTAAPAAPEASQSTSKQPKTVPILFMSIYPKDLSHAVVGCQDGSIRSYVLGDDNLTPATLEFIQMSEESSLVHEYSHYGQTALLAQKAQESIVSAHYFTSRSTEFLLGYTSDGILLVFDMISRTTLLETRILANRIKPKKEDGKENTVPSYRTRRIQIFDVEAGIFGISHGKDWTVLNIKNLVDWKINHQSGKK